MSIDRKSDGVPEVDFSKRTTQVNLGMVIGIGVFFAAAIVGIYCLM